MAAKVLYKASVSPDLEKITPKDKARILGQVEEILGSDPGRGEALRGEFEGLFKLRVGDYRVVYAIVGVDVLVLGIRHRSKAYG